MQALKLSADLKLLITELAEAQKGEKRSERERRAVGQMLRQYFGENVEVAHHASGKPYLKAHQEYSISISHSDYYAGVLLAPAPYIIGLDIEDMAQQVERVRRKFLDECEEQVIKGSIDEMLALHLAWSAKESLYKALNPSEPYLQAFSLKSLDIDRAEQKVALTITYQQEDYELKGFYTDDYVLTFIALKQS